MKKTSLVLAVMLGLFMLLTITAEIAHAMSQADENLIRKIEGRRYTLPGDGTESSSTTIIDVKDGVFVEGWVGSPNYSGTRGYHESSRYVIRGRATIVSSNANGVTTYIISDDGEYITAHVRFSDGSVREYVFLWQR